MWYAFKTAPNQEKKIHDALESAGFTSLFPHEVEEIKRRNPASRCTEIVEIKQRPLLVGYCLIKHTGGDRDRWMQSLLAISYYAGPARGRLPYVRSVVGIPDAKTGRHVPWGIPASAIARLESQSGIRPVVSSKKPRFKVGDTTRIVSGPFASDVAIKIDEVRGQHVRMMLGMYRVDVPVDQLEAA